MGYRYVYTIIMYLITILKKKNKYDTKLSWVYKAKQRDNSSLSALIYILT